MILLSLHAIARNVHKITVTSFLEPIAQNISNFSFLLRIFLLTNYQSMKEGVSPKL